MMEQTKKRRLTYYHATHIEYVRPMFEILWPSAVVSFSALLESTEVSWLITSFEKTGTTRN